MNLMAASLIAMGGVYLFVALHSSTFAVARPEQREYRSLAGYAICLAFVSFSASHAWQANMPAEAVEAQSATMFGLFLCVSLFVTIVLRLSGEESPYLQRITLLVAGLGMMAAATRSFYDPAFIDPGYHWSVGAGAGRAASRLSPIGVALAGAITLVGAYALLRLYAAAREKPDLRVAAALTTGSVVAAFADLSMRALGVETSIHLSIHSALLSVLGFTYVLIGRFTAVDAELESRTGELAKSYDHRRLTQAQIVKNEQLAAVGELSAVIAHEVRNPLAIIKNAVAGLRRPELPSKDGETLLSILDEESDRLNKLIDDLLAYARPIEPGTARVDMPGLVGHAVELAASGNRDISHLELELELGTPCEPIQGDQALLRHALINIVDNALQAMPSGGTLTVSCKDTVVDGRPHVAVEFHDTGEGMDTLVRTRARDPFFTTRDSGTGLGLAMVERVARAHGGGVEIESRHGQGTTVCLVLPRDRAPELD